METLNIYNRAEQLFAAAKEEMMRPEEDIVSYLVCENCHLAISEYLRGYLNNAGVNFSQEAEVTELLDLLIRREKRFAELNQSFLVHPKESKDYWMNIDRAKEYLDVADKMRLMVKPQ